LVKGIKKPWSGRFSGSVSDTTEKITSSVIFDSRLYRYDIKGSISHAKMLHKIGILSAGDLKSIEKGLLEIQRDIESGDFKFSESLEDVHMNIEAGLTERIGEAGQKLHTGRSRNDQISVDMRLYLLDEIKEIRSLIERLIHTLIDLAEKNIDIIMPGYTHLQIAQPVRFSQHMLAYSWKLSRDFKRLEAVKEACSFLPLGSGALAGVNYPSDREFLRKDLGFKSIIPNSMDAVSDRDFILDFLYFSSVLGLHLSRFCEELIIWSSSEFGFIKLDDTVTTGSSIMPQKRNPDIAELIRAKTGRLYGNLISLLTVLKGLPMTYNRDLQEDKEPMFDSVDTVKLSLNGMIEMLSSIEINADKMKESIYKNFSTATDLADYLVIKGIPFRKSHEIIGNIVSYCEKNSLDFFDLKLDVLKGFSPAFEKDVTDYIKPETSAERKLSPGGTSKSEIKNQVKMLRDSFKLS